MAESGTDGEAARDSRQRPRSLLFGAYRLFWTMLFAVAVAAVGFANARTEWLVQRQNQVGFALGITLYQNLAAEGMMLGPFGPEGQALGFRHADLLRSVDGKPVRRFDDAAIAALAGPPGSVARLVIERQDGTVTTLRSRRDPTRIARAYAGWGITFSGRRWLAFAVRALAGIASLAVALLLFLRRPRDRVAQLLSIALVLAQANFANVIPGAPGFLPDLQTSLSGVLLTAAVLLFPHGRLRTRWQWLALGCAVAVYTTTFCFYLLSSYPGWALLVYGAAPATLLVAVLHQLRATPAGISRQQIKSVLFGIALFCVLLLVTNLLTELQSAPRPPGAQAWLVLFTHLSEAFAGIAIPAGLLVSLLRFASTTRRPRSAGRSRSAR